jgi:hypothetical protein
MVEIGNRQASNSEQKGWTSSTRGFIKLREVIRLQNYTFCFFLAVTGLFILNWLATNKRNGASTNQHQKNKIKEQIFISSACLWALSNKQGSML